MSERIEYNDEMIKKTSLLLEERDQASVEPERLSKEEDDGVIVSDDYVKGEKGFRLDRRTGEVEIPSLEDQGVVTVPFVLDGDQELPTLDVDNATWLDGDHGSNPAGNYLRIMKYHDATWWYAKVNPNAVGDVLVIDDVSDVVYSPVGTFGWDAAASAWFSLESTVYRNASGGYAGLTAHDIDVYDAATGLVKSAISSLATAARVWFLPDKSGTVQLTLDRNDCVQCTVFDYTTSVATGDGKFYLHVPTKLNGCNLTYCHARVITAGTTGTMTIQVANVTDGVDMLSTKLTVDSGGTGSETSATPYVIDASHDDVSTNDVIRIDVDTVQGTAAKGLIVTLGFEYV
jgi:hypothetical protein